MCEIGTDIMTLADVDQVHAIETDSFRTPWSRQSFVNDMTENACARYVVLRRKDEVLGYAGMWLVLDEAHITNVAVRRDQRGKGLGRKLMTALIRLAADSGMNWMTLEVRRSNDPARSLYKSLGFIEVGVRKGYYEDTKEDAILMALENLPEGHPENDPFAVEE